ncbi:MAG: Nif3-like dinuclear metal center hexameric protein [Myxococcota bacterium]|nr:Nif3-like dinuclear metal center hexameric protein [Myxococcota bacterium]
MCTQSYFVVLSDNTMYREETCVLAVHLNAVLGGLAEIAPLHLAADWDNVGLLIEPRSEGGDVARGVLTIDLTEAVVAEAIEVDADLIIAYHPPLFQGIKRLVQHTASNRVIMTAIQHGIAVYSPHTALDAVAGGVTDWLVEAAGPVVDRIAIQPDDVSEAPAGMGRIAQLEQAAPLQTCVDRIRTHLGLTHVRVAAASQTPHSIIVESLAVCPGAGGSLLSPLRNVDLILTGEMRHHDVLALNAAGVNVVLTDHTNSERGYLKRLRRRLQRQWGDKIHWLVAQTDRDPLQVMPNR